MFIFTEQSNNTFNSSQIEMKKKKVRNYFSPEEDQKLRELVLKYGDRSWNLVSSLMKTRNQRQCRERWKHYLSCDAIEASQPWTKEEDQIIIQRFNELGGKWTKIARELPGRSDLQVKTRYMKHLRHPKSGRKIEDSESETDENILEEVQNEAEKINLADFAENEKKKNNNAESIPSNDFLAKESDLGFSSIDFGTGFDLLPTNLVSEICQNERDLFQGFGCDFLNWSFE